MTTQTPLSPPSRTAAAPLHTRPTTTESLEPAADGLALDALPLLDHDAHGRTIEPRRALRGHYLALHDGDETRLLRLDRSVTHVGRGAAADVRLDEYRVSRDHAIFVRHGRYCRLLDNRSANGTYLNGRRIVATNVYSGDVISIGPVVIEYIEVE